MKKFGALIPNLQYLFLMAFLKAQLKQIRLDQCAGWLNNNACLDDLDDDAPG